MLSRGSSLLSMVLASIQTIQNPRRLQQELCKVSSRQCEVSLALSELLFYPLMHLFPLPVVCVRRLRVFEAADCKVLGFAPLQLSPSFILSPFSLSLSLGK